MTLKIEAGKYYRTRDGRKVGPMKCKDGVWRCQENVDGYISMWLECGKNVFFIDYKFPQYDLIAEWTDEPETQPETGTLAELNVKPGDVVQWRDGPQRTVTGWDEHGKCYHEGQRFGGSESMNTSSGGWRIVSRASQPETPKLLKDMTDAEIGALVRAHNEGKVIEWTRSPGDADYRQSTEDGGVPIWDDRHAYRVREPKRETVTLYWRKENHAFLIQVDTDTHRITFELINGKPIPGTYTDEKGNTVRIEDL